MNCNQYKGEVIWISGLSAAGKSTLSVMLRDELQSRGIPVFLLDGDLLRSGLCRDLGFSLSDREENIRRAAEVAKILSEAGTTVIAAFITPLEKMRRDLRAVLGGNGFIEIFLDCPLEVCESRDPKGIYRQAISGKLADLTGVSSPFEVPQSADLVLPTGVLGYEETLSAVLRFLEGRFANDSKAVRQSS